MPEDGRPDDDSASAAGTLELVLDAAVLLHVNGQSTNMTVTAVDRLNHGLNTASTLIPTWSSLLLIGPGAATRVAAVSPTGISMRRVATAMAVIDRTQDGPLDSAAVRRGLQAAQRESVSNALIFSGACATGAGALAVVFGAHHPLTVVVVAVSAAIGGLFRRGLGRLGIGVLTQAFVAALIAGLIAVAAVHLNVDDALGLVVLCPAMVLVPGPHILNGALDLLALRVTLGIARLSFVALILAAIAAGLILGLAFAAVGFASFVALVPGVYVFRMLSGLVQFAYLPTPELLTAFTSDGAVATLVIAGMATGLAAPMHAYAVAANRRWRRIR